MQISSSLENNRTFFQKKLRPDISFDVVNRNLTIGGRDACLYCIDGFTKDDTLLKLLQNKILHLSNLAENLQVRVGNRKNINLLRKNIISK